MNKALQQIINYFFAADVPWHFRLLVVMVILFFLGGIYLDNLASSVALELPKIAEGSPGLETETLNAISSHTAKKIENLSSSAKLLYDFSKIALGALLASLSGVITKKEENPNPINPLKSEDDSIQQSHNKTVGGNDSNKSG